MGTEERTRSFSPLKKKETRLRGLESVHDGGRLLEHQVLLLFLLFFFLVIFIVFLFFTFAESRAQRHGASQGFEALSS